ncbi:hypothetical protein [Burkholderia phage BCSR5]|nr:hypothetical protein [Burkholderia phage BCSR5]
MTVIHASVLVMSLVFCAAGTHALKTYPNKPYFFWLWVIGALLFLWPLVNIIDWAVMTVHNWSDHTKASVALTFAVVTLAVFLAWKRDFYKHETRAVALFFVVGWFVVWVILLTVLTNLGFI